MSQDIVTVVDLEAGWQRILAGEAPESIVEELVLDPKTFVNYVRARVNELSDRDGAKQKALLLGRFEELLRCIWHKKADDPKWAMVVVKALGEQSKIIMGVGTGGVPLAKEKLGDIVDLDRVKKVIEDRRQRKIDSQPAKSRG
jgi:hypothetical protein